MPHALICTLRSGALPALKALRAQHLAYIQAHLGEILIGGPARDAQGRPETMIILLRTDDLAAAEAFIDAEPYAASGQVFSDVRVRAWTQVAPEPSTGALALAIAAERAAHAAASDNPEQPATPADGRPRQR
jgi:uncharacterized protein YciI